MAYDWKISAAKAIRDFVITALAVGGAAVCAYFADVNHITQVIGFLPDTIQHALTPLLSAFFVFALNWFKERNK